MTPSSTLPLVPTISSLDQIATMVPEIFPEGGLLSLFINENGEFVFEDIWPWDMKSTPDTSEKQESWVPQETSEPSNSKTTTEILIQVVFPIVIGCGLIYLMWAIWNKYTERRRKSQPLLPNSRPAAAVANAGLEAVVVDRQLQSLVDKLSPRLRLDLPTIWPTRSRELAPPPELAHLPSLREDLSWLENVSPGQQQALAQALGERLKRDLGPELAGLVPIDLELGQYIQALAMPIPEYFDARNEELPVYTIVDENPLTPSPSYPSSVYRPDGRSRS